MSEFHRKSGIAVVRAQDNSLDIPFFNGRTTFLAKATKVGDQLKATDRVQVRFTANYAA